MKNGKAPSQKEKIIPFRKVVASTGPENESESDDMDNEHDRIRDVEKTLQTTREQMITGFGDLKATIAKTETAIVKEVGSAKETMAKTETAIVKEVASARETMAKAEIDIAKSSSNKTFLAMGIIIAVIAIAVTILIAVLGK